MTILKLTKIKLGDNYPIIRVTYREFFSTKDRDVIRNEIGWKWADTDDFCLNNDLLDLFDEASEREYILNGK